MLRFLLVIFLLYPADAQYQDQTRVVGAHGSDVVEAVVNRIRNSCLFPDFKLFLRRLAFVASHDGNDPRTFRAGYDGGIWQIDRDKFEQTKTSSRLAPLISKVNQEFAVTWSSVTWSQLRIPIYSGLAAALYIALLPEKVPRLIELQAQLYRKCLNNNPQAIHSYVNRAQSFNKVCPRTNLDLAFVVDGSSSLGTNDFENAKAFAGKVVDSFKIGPNDVRVAFVTFSTGYKAEFNFKDYTDKVAVKNAIQHIHKPEGRTDTDAALNYASDTLFTSASGARSGTSKVILLLTDGESTHTISTKNAAARTQSKGIIIFSIGVGDHIGKEELVNIASAPKCTHAITLAGYSDLGSLVSEIQKVSCETPTILKTGSYSFSCSKGGFFQIDTKGAETQVTVKVDNGQATFYGSLTNPTPSQGGSSFQSTARPGTSSVILIDREQNPVYISVPLSGTSATCTGSFTVDVGSVKMVKPNTLVTCVENDVPRPCSVVEVYGRIYTLIPPNYAFSNPCGFGTPELRIHPLDQTKFIFCNTSSAVFSFWCGSGHIYEPIIGDCILGNISTTTTTSTTTTPPLTGIFLLGKLNPCTSQSIVGGHYFFPHPFDERKYIHCTNWPPLGYIKECQNGKIWDQRDLTCLPKHVVNVPLDQTDDTVPNPCKNPLRSGDLHFYPHPTDPHKYIQCSQFGVGYVKTCPNNAFWHESIKTCVAHGLKMGSIFR